MFSQHRPKFTLLAAGVLVALAAGAPAAQPNIILIMADDMGYECVGANGSDHYETPRLDDLAKEGMRFTQAHSQPLCTPTRVKIMTGKYNFRNYTAFRTLELDERTFAHALKEAGYATAIAGKWQLGYDSSLPEHFGFDEHCLWQLSQHPREGERYAKPLMERNGEFLPRYPDAYGPDIAADFAVDFISRKQDGPFFLYYPMVLPHNPFVPTPDSEGWNEGDRYKRNKAYFKDMVTYIDKIAGRLADRVTELGLAEDTLFLFTTDNGTHRGIASPFKGRTVQGGKGMMTDAGTRVPFIAWWPGTIEPGGVHDGLIGFEDFFPTLLDAAGHAGKAEGLDGRSFLPLLQGEAYEPNPWLFMHYDPRWGAQSQHRGRFARTVDYKLYGDGRFYNVPEDPKEKSPLDADSLSEDVAEVRAMLQGVLDKMEQQGSVMSEEGAPDAG